MTHGNGWTACVRLGVRAAWRHRGLVILVWALFLAAALLAVAPAWRWWNGALNFAPEGDRLLDGLNLALLRELSHYDRSSTYVIALASVSAFLLAALVINPFVAGGLIAVLLQASREREQEQAGTTHAEAAPAEAANAEAPSAEAPSAEAPSGEAPSAEAAHAEAAQAEPRPVRGRVSSWTRFFAGGGQYYGLFLRLLLFAGVLGGLFAAVFLLVLIPIRHYVDARNLEQPYLFVSAAIPVAVAVAVWLASLVLDLARIRAVRDQERRAWRAMLGGLRFLWRHTGATLALGVAFALLTSLTFAVYFTVSSSFTPASSIAILLAIIWQQMLSLTRAGLRVSLLAGELELVQAREPSDRG